MEVLDQNEIQENSSRVNINKANKIELMELEGIGEKTAERIIKYRQNNKFNNIQDIMEVKGIGEKKYDKIKNYICI